MDTGQIPNTASRECHAWHSTVDLNAGNDHIKIPEAYKCIARASLKPGSNDVESCRELVLMRVA